MWFKTKITDSVSAVDPNGKAVVVTGASSGIGRKTTEMLASRGFRVYAGARAQSDIESLALIENVQPVKLDVTRQEDIDSLVRLLESDSAELTGVVNNAGIISVGSLIEVDEEDVQRIFDVNVFGVYRVTKALAPMIISAKGRIVNISSVSGVLSSKFRGLYSMSKHAIEAYTDSLSREMKHFGVRVCAVVPGDYNSRLGKNMLIRMERAQVDHGGSLFRDQIVQLSGWFAQDFNGKLQEPDSVASAVYEALTVAKPKKRYMVTPNKKQAERTIRRLFRKAAHLNVDHKHNLSDRKLRRMLGKEMDSG